MYYNPSNMKLVNKFVLYNLIISLTLLVMGCQRTSEFPKTIEPTLLFPATVTDSSFTPGQSMTEPVGVQGTEPVPSPYPEPIKVVSSPTSPGNGTAYPNPLTQATPTTAGTIPGVSPYPLPQTSAASGQGFAAPHSPTSPVLEPSPKPTETKLVQVTFTPTSPGNTAYPGPQATPAKPTVTPTSLTTVTPEYVPGVTVSATPTATLSISSTITLTPTEFTGAPVGSAPAAGATVRIWHSWSGKERDILKLVIGYFQDRFPDINFDVLYIPQSDLNSRYQQATYYGGGPNILLGSAEWGPNLYDQGLVVDISRYTSQEFLDTINPAALGTTQYRGGLICLPYAQGGVVLYRNTGIISKPASTYDELVDAARVATKDGIVGAFFEQGAFFSAGHLLGMGGRWMGEEYQPAFSNSTGVSWINLVASFDRGGIAGLNTSRDTELFSQGKIGWIIDGSWNRQMLADAIGVDNLAIDPWPSVGMGDLAGFVQTDCIYLNENTSQEDRLPSLLFMGFLMDWQVQGVLAEAGLIPSVLAAQPRDEHIRQIMEAFAGGVPYPVVPDGQYLRAYWDALDFALRGVIESGADPAISLQIAANLIRDRLEDLVHEP